MTHTVLAFDTLLFFHFLQLLRLTCSISFFNNKIILGHSCIKECSSSVSFPLSIFGKLVYFIERICCKPFLSSENLRGSKHARSK